MDLKADRQNSRLLVLAVHEEPDSLLGDCVDALASELLDLQLWLQLDGIEVTRHNPISRQLAARISQ